MKTKWFFTILMLGLATLPANLLGQDISLGGVQVHGFLSQGFMVTTHNDFIKDSSKGTFQFNEIGINFSKDLTDKLRVGVQFFSRDMGDVDNNRIVVDWAFADYRLKDYLGFRLGIIKRPTGFYNEYRDVDSLRTWILLPGEIYPEEYRESALSTQGLGLYGKVGLKKAGSLDYQFQVGTTNIPSDQARGKQLADFGFNVSQFDVKSVVVGSLIWNTPLSGFRMGTTSSRYDLDIENVTNQKFGPYAGIPLTLKYKQYTTTFSGEYTHQNLTLMAEFMRSDGYDKEYFRGGPADGSLFANGYTPSSGWYLGGTYRFKKWFEAGSYYGQFYPNLTKKPESGLSTPNYFWSKDWALSSRFDINEHFTIKAEGHFFNGTALFPRRLNPNPVENSFLFALKASFNF
jgi:hypothetical protein